ncbi:MAG: cyclase family protein [Candidatus Omnitrophica bacterium]|nr:cyclase family protein [Candidatus Omnitrophota bacterium]
MKYIDLTGMIENGMWEYGHPYPKVEIAQVSSIDDSTSYADYKVNAHRITFSSSSATYVQTSAEMFKGKPTIEQIPLERLILDAVVVRIAKGPAEVITVKELEEKNLQLKKGEGLIVATGWEKFWNKENFVKDSPHFTPESMTWVLSKGISLLAGDMTIYDDYYQPTGLLKDLFSRDVLVVAPLINLEKITRSRVKLIALPLKVKGISGCPCRVVAIEE